MRARGFPDHFCFWRRLKKYIRRFPDLMKKTKKNSSNACLPIAAAEAKKEKPKAKKGGRGGLRNAAVSEARKDHESFKTAGVATKGFLLKMTNRKMGRNTWQKRWFVAGGHYLRYYKDEAAEARNDVGGIFDLDKLVECKTHAVGSGSQISWGIVIDWATSAADRTIASTTELRTADASYPQEWVDSLTPNDEEFSNTGTHRSSRTQCFPLSAPCLLLFRPFSPQGFSLPPQHGNNQSSRRDQHTSFIAGDIVEYVDPDTGTSHQVGIISPRIPISQRRCLCRSCRREWRTWTIDRT
jgi:hypothetical protein